MIRRKFVTVGILITCGVTWMPLYDWLRYQLVDDRIEFYLTWFAVAILSILILRGAKN
jgi:hypothetical protein